MRDRGDRLMSLEELDALEEEVLAGFEEDPLADVDKLYCAYCEAEFDFEEELIEHENDCLQEQGWYGGGDE